MLVFLTELPFPITLTHNGDDATQNYAQSAPYSCKLTSY